MTIKKDIRGVSIIEAMISLTVFGIALAILYMFFVQGSKVQQYGSEQYTAVENARRGIQQMVKEIREAAAGDDGSYILQTANDQEIIFFSDVDADLATERIRYFLDNTTLKKGVVEPTGDPISYPVDTEQIAVVSEYVQNGMAPIFTYYNGNYPGDDINNPLPAPARLVETKLINVYLKVNVTPTISPDDIELQSDVQIRNLKINL